MSKLDSLKASRENQARNDPLPPAVVKLARALGADCSAFANNEDAAGEDKTKPKGTVKK
jgi:hypothetical protein